MRILAITHNFPNEGNRNHGIFAARQLAEMKKQGAEIVVLTPTVWCPSILRNVRRWKLYNHKWIHKYQDITAINIPYLRLPGRWYQPLAHRAVYLSIKNKAISMHRKKPFDIIYSRFLYPEGYAVVRLSKALGIPGVGVGAGSEVNVFPNESRVFRHDIITILNKIDGLISSGDKVADNIFLLCGKRATVIHGVVDLEEFKPVEDKASIRKELGLPLDSTIVLYLGTFKIAKGIFELIDAFARIQCKTSGVMLIFCGYGRQQKKMRQIIRNKGAESAIRIEGMVDSLDVHKWMQASDIFTLPSYAEGMPNAVMEAMACGLPIIASAVGGLIKEIGDCDGAVLIEPKNVDQIEKFLLKVIDSKPLRSKMSKASRERAVERFGVQQNAEKVLCLLEDTMVRCKRQ